MLFHLLRCPEHKGNPARYLDPVGVGAGHVNDRPPVIRQASGHLSFLGEGLDRDMLALHLEYLVPVGQPLTRQICAECQRGGALTNTALSRGIQVVVAPTGSRMGPAGFHATSAI